MSTTDPTMTEMLDTLKPLMRDKPIETGIKRIHHGTATLAERRITFASLITYFLRLEEHGDTRFLEWRKSTLEYLTALCATET